MSQLKKHTAALEARENISLSLPLIGSWLIYSLSGFIGTVMVAHLGEDALAASVLVTAIWSTLSVFFFGIFSAVSILISHQYGARNFGAISGIMGQAFLQGFFICFPIMFAILLVPYILDWTSQTPLVTALATQYGHALLWSIPGVIVLIILEHFLNGIGKTKMSLWISLLEVPFEIFLMYGFVFGKFGFPNCGIAGVGYGIAASYTITAILLIAYLYRARFAKPFHLFKKIGHFDKPYFTEILRVGVPIGITYLIEVSAFMFVTFFMAHFNTHALAAHQIAMQYMGLTINVAYAMAQAVSIRIGLNVGRQDMVGVRYASYVGLSLVGGVVLLISCLYLFLPELLLRVDSAADRPINADVAKEAISFLMILGVFQFFDSIRIMETGILRGLKDTKFAMYNSVITFWVIGTFCAFLFGFGFGWEGKGIWWGMTLGVAVGALILSFRSRMLLRRNDLSDVIRMPGRFD